MAALASTTMATAAAWVSRSVAATANAWQISSRAADAAALLHDKDTDVRVEALRALAIVGTTKEAAAVAELADDPSTLVQRMALRMLVATNARAQRPVLEKWAAGKDDDLAAEAQQALRNWDGK